MQESSHTSFKKHTDTQLTLGLAVSTLLFIGMGISSQNVLANPFLPSTPPTSPVGSCPAGHKMYYIGANPPAYSPMNSENLSWTNGNPSRTFTFVEASGDKTFLINFPLLLDLNNNYGGTPPFYGSINGATRACHQLA